MAITKVKSKKYGFTYQVDVRYKDSNGVSQRHIKSGFTKRKDAVIYEATVISKAQNNEPIVDNKLKFADVFNEFMSIEGKNRYAFATYSHINSMYNAYLKKDFGNKKFSEQTHRDIQNYFNKKSKKNSYSILINLKRIMSNVYNYGIRAGYISNNPVKYAILENKTNNDENVKIISNEDFERLLKQIVKTDPRYHKSSEAKFTFQSYRIALLIGRYTGLRISETLALEKSDFDLNAKKLNIQKRLEHTDLKREDLHYTDILKSRASKSTVEIGDRLVNELKEWFAINPYELVVCTGNGEFIKPNSFRKKLNKVSQKLGIEFHYHMLRHTYATELMMSGANPLVVKDIMRHSRVQTTWDYYIHSQREDERKALDEVYDNDALKIKIKL